MKDTNKSRNLSTGGLIRRLVPYFVFFAIILTTMIVGSQKDQKSAISSTVLNVINDNNFAVTADQLSESYIVAETANVLNLPSANSIGENYVSVAVRYATTGALDTGIIQKPTIVDTSNLSSGIITYTVKEGETLAGIVAQMQGRAPNLTTTQVRWSNNMKNETLSVGQTLYIPPVAGILYTVKAGDTIDEIAEKYKSNARSIRQWNGLEKSEPEVGQTIILPGGELPEKERPEYVPPAPKPTYTSYSLTDSGVRHNLRELYSYNYWRYSITPTVSSNDNRSTPGQCTWFVWWWRRTHMPESHWLPIGEIIGNARDWVSKLSSRYVVNRYPSYGAVIQTRTSGYGHVAVVTGVVEGEYITIQEMNYNYQPYRVYESDIYWADALNFVYIHGKY